MQSCNEKNHEQSEADPRKSYGYEKIVYLKKRLSYSSEIFGIVICFHFEHFRKIFLMESIKLRVGTFLFMFLNIILKRSLKVFFFYDKTNKTNKRVSPFLKGDQIH